MATPCDRRDGRRRIVDEDDACAVRMAAAGLYDARVNFPDGSEEPECRWLRSSEADRRSRKGHLVGLVRGCCQA